MAELTVQKREVLGGKTAKLRKDGFIPAELYGHGFPNLHLSVPTQSFMSVYKEAGEHSIVNVIFEGESKPVLIHDVSRDPVTDEILSVDFYQVRMDEKVTTHVPVEFTGESPAVRDMNGVLVKVVDELEIEALPAEIPSSIIVDISSITELGQSIYVRDLSSGEKYTIKADPDTVLVSVSEQRVEEEVPVEKELTPEDVIVEGEEKRAREASQEEQSGDEQGE